MSTMSPRRLQVPSWSMVETRSYPRRARVSARSSRSSSSRAGCDGWLQARSVAAGGAEQRSWPRSPSSRDLHHRSAPPEPELSPDNFAGGVKGFVGGSLTGGYRLALLTPSVPAELSSDRLLQGWAPPPATVSCRVVQGHWREVHG